VKKEEFDAAMAMLAEADQRATAGLIEMLTATLLLKLDPPARGDDVVQVTVSPRDIAETVRTHHFESQYNGDEMTIFLTPLAEPRETLD